MVGFIWNKSTRGLVSWFFQWNGFGMKLTYFFYLAIYLEHIKVCANKFVYNVPQQILKQYFILLINVEYCIKVG